MSAAPSWPLVSSLPLGNEPSGKRLPPSPGLNFDPFRGRKPNSRDSSPEFVLQTFKTQNDARGAETHPPVQTMSSRTAKARNCPSPDGLMGRNAGLLTTNRAFVLPTRYGLTSPEFRGASPRFPTHFCVQRATGQPVARRLLRLPGPGSHRPGQGSPGLVSLARGWN